MDSNQQYIPQLDGFRALACLMVLGAHLWRYPPGHDLSMRLFGGGWMGVDLFFVLSGFLITRILHNSKDRPRYYRDFYIRRALRIFPANYLLMGIVLFVLPMVSSFPELMRVKHDELWYLFYGANIIIGLGGWQLSLLNITWSLAIEEQFYMAWPTLVRWLSTGRMKALCVGIIAGAPLARAILYPHIGWTWCYVATPLRADAFAWGALIALGGTEVFRRYAWLMLGIATAIIVPALATGNFMREQYWVSAVGYSLTSMGAAAGLWLTIQARRSIFATPILRHIGKVSYGLYLLHLLVAVAVSRFFEGRTLLGSYVFMLITATLAVGVATLSFRYFESPLLRLKDRFSYVPVPSTHPARGVV